MHSGCDESAPGVPSLNATRSRPGSIADLVGEGPRRSAAPSTGHRSPGPTSRRGAPRCRGPSASARARRRMPFTASPYSGPSGLRARARLETEEPATRRGVPDRAAEVVGVRHRDHARRDRGRRAAARAARASAPVFHGLRVGPNSAGSHTGRMPNSGVLVLPRITRPARSRRRASSWSCVETLSARNRDPSVNRIPASPPRGP